MSTHPVIHTLHDLGLATWTGGSLMGAVGLNGAVSSLSDPRERSRVSTKGWTRWAPVNAAGIGAHLIGAASIFVNDLPRVRKQQGVARSSAIKTAATAAGLGVAAWSGVLNRKMAAAVPVPVQGSTEASASTPDDVARTLRQLKLVQWLNPAAGFALIAVTAWQEEQQRATEQAKGRLQKLRGPVPALAGAGALGLVGLLAARRRSGSAEPYPPAGFEPPPTIGVPPVPPLDVVEVDMIEVDVVELDAGDVAAPLTDGPGDGPRTTY